MDRDFPTIKLWLKENLNFDRVDAHYLDLESRIGGGEGEKKSLSHRKLKIYHVLLMAIQN